MKVSYNKLWESLVDKGMSKPDLRKATCISTVALAKMSKGEDVNVSIITRVCTYFKCDIGDIMGIKQIVAH